MRNSFRFAIILPKRGDHMNDEGRSAVRKCAEIRRTAQEYRSQLMLEHNMSLLCHRSGELNQSTLLYFDVNDLYLNQDGSYILILFSVTDSPHSEGGDAGFDLFNQAFQYDLVAEIVNEVFQDHYTYHAAQIDGQLVVLVSFHFGLIHDAQMSQSFDRKAYQMIADQAYVRYGLNLAVYYSPPITGLSPISSMYHRLLNMSTLDRFLGKENFSGIFLQQPPEPKVQETIDTQPEQLAALMTAGQGADSALVSQILDQLKQSGSAPDELKQNTRDFLLQMANELQKKGIHLVISDLLLQCREALDSALDWSAVEEFVRRQLHAMEELCVNRRRLSRTRRLEEVRQYADEHLSDPSLSVSQLAERFEFNQSFLSTAFREEYGIRLSDYITEKRLDRAKELLENTTAPIREICFSCGWGSIGSFYRAYSKRFGSSPGAYRRPPRG